LVKIAVKCCTQKSKKLQEVTTYNSWKQLKTLNYIYFEYLGSCKK